MTSPPYWRLRDYEQDGQIGLEPTVGEYVDRLVEVFREVHRVLAEDGTLWLNLGDSYSGKAGGCQGKNGQRADRSFTAHVPPKRSDGIKPKNLLGIPWRVAFALQDDGWWLRSDIVWAKPNPMPESVTDRPTRAHEYVFLLSKSRRYFYDHEAVKEPDCGRPSGNGYARPESISRGGRGQHEGWEPGSGRNRRSVWTIRPEPYPGTHFAVMPTALVEPCILAGSEQGDTVLDPFCGTGTVGVVALRHGRKFVGVDLNPDYIEMARTRIKSDDKQVRMFTPVGKVFP